jgi:hypothetical protein
MNGRALCALHLAAGIREECPGTTCAYWEDGRVARCAFERVRFEIETRPVVARWLLKVRSDLESRGTSLNQVLPPGLHE